ncbi:MAG: response regulator [Chthoniobacterales bacterium]|nr:response regulator [Chthoniobacterales bacterium]
MNSPASILVVDDEQRWVDTLARVLMAAGHRVQAVRSGEEALAAIEAALPDILLLDVRMPGMGGFEVMRRLGLQKKMHGVPILLLSGFAEVEERMEGLKLGAVDSITKPFHAGELLARVRMQVELARLRARHARHEAEMNAVNSKLQEEIARRRRIEEALESRLLALTLPGEPPAGLALSDLFAIEDIQRLQDKFADATGVASIITAPDGTPITAPSKFSRFCMAIRGTDLGRTNCHLSDAVLGVPCDSGPTIQPCLSGGLWDAGASIMVGGEHIANWLIGQVRNEAQGEEEMLKYAEKIGMDQKDFLALLAEVPVMSVERFTKTAELLFVFANELSTRAFQNVQQARFLSGLRESEASLRRREEDYRLLFEGMLEGFALHEILCDDSGKPVDYRFLSVNPAFERITGFRGAEIVGRTVREVVPEIEADWIERYGRVALTGEPIHFEKHSAALKKDFQITAYRPKDGQFAVLLEDITERKIAEARVIRLNQLHTALSLCNQAIVHSASAEELLPKICRDVVESGGMALAWIGFVDEAGLTPRVLYGRGRECLEGVTFPLDPREALARGPAATSIRENRPVWCRDFAKDPTTALWHEHGVRHGWNSAAALPLHQRGKAVGAFLVYSDKTNVLDEEVCSLLEKMADNISFALDGYASESERRRAEEALRESEERLRLVLQHISSIAVQRFDRKGIVHYWNEASEVLYGYTAEEAIGKSLVDLLFPPEAQASIRETLNAMYETRQPIPPGELVLRRKDGEALTVFCNHVIVNRPGHEPEIFCFDIDLTERKRAEKSLVELNRYLAEATARAEELAVKAEAAARAKSEFLALMSHELRTPLNGVLGFAELLSSTSLDEEQQDFIRTILDSGNHLLGVVNDILDFSSIEKGRMPIESERIRIPALLEAASSPIRKMALDKGIALHCVKAADVPNEIFGDERRIRQILLNLLGNAIKFTVEGSVVLGVTRSLKEGLTVLEFSVEDTGPGIPPETLAHLFVPFTQADSTASRPFAGTGLGLAISRRLAEAMGGTLNVVSLPGQGSTFTFCLPLDEGSPAPENVSPKMSDETPPGNPYDETPASGEAAPTGFQTVLVVEDDTSNRILMGKMLDYLGYRVEFASNGREALDGYDPSRISAILMDMQMPVLDGLEATRKIRQLKSGGRVPIIALTANVMPGDRERCLEAGMDDYLSKPVKLKDLSESLSRFLRV